MLLGGLAFVYNITFECHCCVQYLGLSVVCSVGRAVLCPCGVWGGLSQRVPLPHVLPRVSVEMMEKNKKRTDTIGQAKDVDVDLQSRHEGQRPSALSFVRRLSSTSIRRLLFLLCSASSPLS